MTTLVFVGVDVSKAFLDVAVRPTSATARPPHDPAGHAALAARLAALAPDRVALAATGGDGLPARTALAAAGVPAAAVNPRQARGGQQRGRRAIRGG